MPSDKSVKDYDPSIATPNPDLSDVKVKEGAGVVHGREEEKNVRTKHIQKEQLKQKLVDEGKISEAERSRYQ